MDQQALWDEHFAAVYGDPPGDHVVMLAFGPGLTLYAALLRAT